jgi:LuxR family maltose regulon positive regulatory protein
MTIQIVRALAYRAQGELDRALAALETALSLAEPGGHVRIFLDEGPPMAALLSEAARRATATDYLARLLAAFEAETTAEGVSDRPLLPEPLSGRELEVLQLVAQGLSNREIGARLHITVRTVKWHTGNIFGKLNVRNRTQAVTKARTMGLLSDRVAARVPHQLSP